MQVYIIIMLDVYAQPPPASAGNVSPDEGIAPLGAKYHNQAVKSGLSTEIMAIWKSQVLALNYKFLEALDDFGVSLSQRNHN
jgi:hypothetical protein